MSGITAQLRAQKQHSLEQIHSQIHYLEGVELVSKSPQTIRDVTVWTLVYEKYFARIGGYASLTVVLTECDQEQTACVVACGGGEGIANASWGANRRFARDCVAVLQECGFTVTDADPALEKKGLFSRFWD